MSKDFVVIVLMNAYVWVNRCCTVSVVTAEELKIELKLEKLLWDLKSTLGQYIKKITGFSDMSVMAICCVFGCFAQG